MLGMGRDCTALVDSYHPHTMSKCRQVMEKYRLPSLQPKKKKNLEQDFFYDVLCERVAKTLEENGIDPVSDRGATTARWAYYILIATAVFASAYLHAKVRDVSFVFRATSRRFKLIFCMFAFPREVYLEASCWVCLGG